MQVDKFVDSTIMLSKEWAALGTTHLDGKIRRIDGHRKTHDGHNLTVLGSFNFDIEWNDCRYTQQQQAVVQSDKQFPQLGIDFQTKHGMSSITTKHLPAVMDYKAL